jgi:hypothetical protein
MVQSVFYPLRIPGKVAYITIALVLSFFSLRVMAQQGVAVNATGNPPAASAMLDVQSTTKGFLLPRMTQAQRLAISSPANGLLVFDTDAQKLFQYQDGVWRYLIDNSYWAGSATRRWIYNASDSIGIGTALPSEKLHVSNGNLKVSNGDIKLDGGDFLLNKPDGIIQLQSAGEDKGFIQLSGNDLRIGTNVANAAGSLIVRTQGANQVTINQGGLEMTGNGKILRNNTDTNNLVPACYGQIRENGTIIYSTPNVTAWRVQEGVYYVSFPGRNDNAFALITPRESNVRVMTTYNPAAGVYISFQNITTGVKQDASFNFVVFNP